jgi:molybdopterin-guanine dinucleotide biosynthesis protein A
MIATEDITGLILAGGAGRRVEGRDKGLINWQGKPLVQHVALRLRPQVGQLIISCNRNIETYRELADKTVTDSRRDFQGPLAGLEAASSIVGTMFLVVVACDTPTLPKDLISRLLAPLDKAEGRPAQISYAHDGQRDQYLCAAINRQCLPSLAAYLDEGHRSVHGWYQRHTATSVDFSDKAASFRNLNRMA